MSANFQPARATSPSTMIELSISARNLTCEDLLSKSDPLCVTYVQRFGSTDWMEYHRTETIKDTHNPDFVRKVQIAYHFEEIQPMKFEIYDVDSASGSLKEHDFLSFVTCNLSQIVSSKRLKLTLQTKTDYGRVVPTAGCLIINAEEVCECNDDVIMQFCGTDLDKKDFFGKSDPFLEIYKSTDSGEYVLVHKTEVIKNTLHPTWNRFSVAIRTLCNGDYERILKIVCWDWNATGSPSLIGHFLTSLTQLSESQAIFPLVHPEKKKKKANYKNSGELKLLHFEVQHVYSFLEYLQGGMQIHCTVAIDFTGSNGDPLQPSSLHFIGGRTPNLYEQAITAVVSIIEQYDQDKQFPVLGFGARLPPDGHISHDFCVNMTVNNPYCAGINGVLEAYRSCVRHVQLHGPTNFAPVIENVINFAQTYQDGRNYFVLLILTDGIISDMPQTTQAIVKASTLPVSIIIVGIGEADFGAMEELDADRGALRSVSGDVALRDIVQFVPFGKFLKGGDQRNAHMQLAKEVLAEIPGQVVSYMKANAFTPGQN